eukprot:3899980-Amphidinium_carterae.1
MAELWDLWVNKFVQETPTRNGNGCSAGLVAKVENERGADMAAAAGSLAHFGMDESTSCQEAAEEPHCM